MDQCTAAKFVFYPPDNFPKFRFLKVLRQHQTIKRRNTAICACKVVRNSEVLPAIGTDGHRNKLLPLKLIPESQALFLP